MAVATMGTGMGELRQRIENDIWKTCVYNIIILMFQMVILFNMLRFERLHFIIFVC